MPNRNPVPQIKDKDQYEALKRKGYSKQKAARISYSVGAEKRGGEAKPYEKQSKKDLMSEAAKVENTGRSKMSKEELMQALRHN